MMIKCLPGHARLMGQIACLGAAGGMVFDLFSLRAGGGIYAQITTCQLVGIYVECNFLHLIKCNPRDGHELMGRKSGKGFSCENSKIESESGSSPTLRFTALKSFVSRNDILFNYRQGGAFVDFFWLLLIHTLRVDRGMVMKGDRCVEILHFNLDLWHLLRSSSLFVSCRLR